MIRDWPVPARPAMSARPARPVMGRKARPRTGAWPARKRYADSMGNRQFRQATGLDRHAGMTCDCGVSPDCEHDEDWS